ncbi:DUF4274 domain-containing protein [Shewanella sp.]|uniref:DUF4274 domain-containing protein n=1 Tax=Shewanella sp. TaxID=50422 RepID=UPI003A985085
MAKRLTREQFLRAFECSEAGAISSPEKLSAWLADAEMVDVLKSIAAEFDKSAEQLVCISQLQSMEELHYVAANLNWDDGITAAQAIINHPLCDAGTALLLYWRGQGYWYSKPNSPAAEKQFFAELIARFSDNRFASYRIAYDAVGEMMLPSLKELQQNQLSFPGILLCQYSTMQVAVDEHDYQQFIR